MTLDDFYKEHAPNRHGLTKLSECVFCFGGYDWKRGEKRRRSNWTHMIKCLKSFVKRNRIRETPAEAPAETPPEPPMCGEQCRKSRLKPRDMCGRVKDRTNEYLGFYEPVFEKPDMWIEPGGVKFDARCGLGPDAYGIVKKYLGKTMKWFHLMVKHNAFDTFVREMTPIRDEFVVLSYWCLCDGLEGENGQRQTHRHMIVACELESTFLHILTYKVRISNDRAKLTVPIKNVHHLFRTMVYVSRPRASCNRGLPDDLEVDDGSLSHFYLSHSMSEHAIAFLCPLVPGGIEKLLEEQNKNKDVVDWEEHAIKRPRNWRVPIGITGFRFQHCVIPVDKQYEPTEEETDFCLYLHGENFLYFKVNPSLLNLSDDEWLVYQAGKGNTFRSIRDELYVLSPKQQNVMNQIKSMENKMETRIKARWEHKYSELQAKNVTLESKFSELQAKHVTLEKQLIMVEKERDSLKNELADLKIEVLRTELSTTKAKMIDYEAKLAIAEAKIVELKRMLSIL
ncbi:hypothetical protein AVEN_103905-1 [Araneus ventricosus]|uniref:Uncharacterized protein n=1 Tax=Araneus ventricosus TaxID=182803 RepID=A0A4Y2CKD1_ARAVE|nr:hypothetical protein AVEN_103905-1 [Araneus ventricosus]